MAAPLANLPPVVPTVATPLAPPDKARWWWATRQCETNEEAIAWRPSEKPKLVYCCWRPHAAPTTGKPHVHVLMHFATVMRFTTLQNKGFSNLKWCGTEISKTNRRQYCILDVHKDGTTKDPIGPFMEQGTWGIEQGERMDLINAKKAILGKRRWDDVLMDDDLVKVVSKYGKWAREVFDIRPREQAYFEFDLIRSWQQDVMDILEQPPKKRQIIWIWSTEHGTGKSTFKDYLITKGKRILDGCSRIADTVYAFDDHEIIWFDCAKAETEEDRNRRLYANVTQTDKYDEIFYFQLEKLSNMTTHTSSKYNSRTKLVWAHIIVTSNEKPPLVKLPDRITGIHATIPDSMDVV